MKRWELPGNRHGIFARKRRTLRLSEAAWTELANRAAEHGLGILEFLENWTHQDPLRRENPGSLPIEEQLQARNRDLLALYKILEATLKDGPLQSIYAEIVEEVGAATGFPTVAIELYDPERRVMTFAGVRGVAPLSNRALEVPVDETLSGTVACEGKPVVRHYTPGEAKQCDTNDTLSRLGIVTFICVPMHIEERVVGVLSLAHSERVAVDDAFVRWVGSLAGNIASLTERRRVEAALRQSHEQLESRVEERTAAMVRLNERLQQEIAERQRSQERLEQSEESLRRTAALAQEQVEELARLNLLKDEFLSTVSHELRTPLTNIRLAIEMLSSAADPLLHGRYLDILRRECRRKIQLVDELLELQSFTAGARPLAPEPIDLTDWLAAVTEPFLVRTQQRGQKLRVETGNAPRRLLIDRVSLERIAVELLTNACKYTPHDGEIVLCFAVEVVAGNPAAVLTVANTGAEILPEDQVRIFENFYRIPGGDPRQEGGTGLGLVLVQKLVERMAATISVESSGGWNRFRVEFARDVLA